MLRSLAFLLLLLCYNGKILSMQEEISYSNDSGDTGKKANSIASLIYGKTHSDIKSIEMKQTDDAYYIIECPTAYYVERFKQSVESHLFEHKHTSKKYQSGLVWKIEENNETSFILKIPSLPSWQVRAMINRIKEEIIQGQRWTSHE